MRIHKFLSAVIAMIMFGALLAGQMRQIGVMKVLGAQPRQLVSMYLLTAALIGAASSLLALPLVGFHYASGLLSRLLSK